MKEYFQAKMLFEQRHHGVKEKDLQKMLATIGVSGIDELIGQTVPASIRKRNVLNLPEPLSETEFIEHFRILASKNKQFKSLIGNGYYGTHLPAVIQRNILENPGWYTAYTPYQAEIAQGRLEALLNFQTMITDLTGMEIANASLLDESTAAAEAMSMMFALKKGTKKKAPVFFVDENVFQQTIDVLKVRSAPVGIRLEIGNIQKKDLSDPELYGVLVQYPDRGGAIYDYTDLIAEAKKNEVFVTVAADLMALTMITPPGEMGADVVVGSTQRFGVALGFGGPHAAYFATRDAYKRNIPGRIIGASVDKKGNPAYRMALQTREQHIRREKATSNICTSQVLLAVLSGMYATYHGPEGLKKISGKIHAFTVVLNEYLRLLGYNQKNQYFFDTLSIEIKEEGLIQKIRKHAERKWLNFNYFTKNTVILSLDETVSEEDLTDIIAVFAEAKNKEVNPGELEKLKRTAKKALNDSIQRKTAFLQHPVFNKYHTEHEILRYIKRLENKDLSMVHSMISLGSCTMKLNATTEMMPITWPELATIHPFVPSEQAGGYHLLFTALESFLTESTGFAATSLQPNSGAQGEFAGLMVIREYHISRGQHHRNIVLIPSSAHGTNPASAVMAGMQVVIVQCDEMGNIDIEDLSSKANTYKEKLAALMVTYPSTHGVFEEGIIEICKIIHENGGQVYMDGANMNAQVGLTSPAIIGADVCHLNLHKTFSIPHGGGGPGVGPICVAAHLVDFLPGNALVKTGGEKAIHGISAAPWGSAGVLAISYAYIKMMGSAGLTRATKMAILNANYLKSRLESEYPILYSGKNGRCAHEMIVDCRSFKKAGIEVEDIAKRLMDYGFHAPTVSFPVPGTLMIEPTESESMEELDRFCDAMLSIREEIRAVENGISDAENNVLKNAPHTADVVMADDWEYPYTRNQAAYPLPFVKANKFWPSVSRIDNAYGDRNLVCSCIPVEAYIEEAVSPE